jgi:hypothetical protein
MKRMFPGRHVINTVSLRTLIVPPSYQICRFFFTYDRPGGARLDKATIVDGFQVAAKARPHVLRVAELPLGSRGFSACESAAIVLPQDSLLHYNDDPFGLAANGGTPISELIIQAYVHNTRGYCRTIIESMKYLTRNPAPKAFLP